MEISFYQKEYQSIQSINTRLEKEMIQLAPSTMKIKVIDESERKWLFQKRKIILYQFIVKNIKFNLFLF